MKSKLNCDRGQTTTEYVMLIAVLVSIILVLGSAFAKKVTNLFKTNIGGSLEKQFYNPGQMHRFPVRIPK